MKQFEINAQMREVGSKAAIKQMRREGLVPCVLYGNNVENVHFALVEKDLKGLIFTPNSFIVALNFNGNVRLCVLHEAQFHPVTDRVLHLDFLAVNESQPVVINVPVSIVGNSVGVRQGGKLQVVNRKLRVKGLIQNLPDTLEVDITNLQLGKNITAGELTLENIQMVSPAATIICMVKMTRAAAAAASQAE